ncbi:MAG: LysR substrate-binding domain-containing protein [Pseudomonadota bacterium]
MVNVSIRQLRSIIAISKHGKLSDAAKSLGLTSPAVTLQLKQLEEEIDSQLFIRTRGGAIATEMGQVFVDSAHRILAEIEGLEERVEELKGASKGRLNLGVVSTGKYFAPRMIAAFETLYPGIEIHLTTANRDQIIHSLENYEIDLALMGRPPKHFDVVSNRFGDHPLVFIAHPEHLLARKIDLQRREIMEHKLLLREPGSGTRAAFEIFMADLFNVETSRFTIMQSNETIKQAVMADLGVALISGHTIEKEVESKLLKVLDVQNTPLRREWYTVQRADKKPTPAMDAFEGFLRKNGLRLLPIVQKTYPDQGADETASNDASRMG